MTAKSHSFELRHIIYASPDKVFDALTNPAVLKKWIEGTVIFEPEMNGRVELFDGWMKGSIIRFENGKSISYTWKPSTWDKKAKESIVEMTFKKADAGTEINLTHSHFPSEKEAESHQQGWINFVFDPLNDFFIGQM